MPLKGRVNHHQLHRYIRTTLGSINQGFIRRYSGSGHPSLDVVCYYTLEDKLLSSASQKRFIIEKQAAPGQHICPLADDAASSQKLPLKLTYDIVYSELRESRQGREHLSALVFLASKYPLSVSYFKHV